MWNTVLRDRQVDGLSAQTSAAYLSMALGRDIARSVVYHGLQEDQDSVPPMPKDMGGTRLTHR